MGVRGMGVTVQLRDRCKTVAWHTDMKTRRTDDPAWPLVMKQPGKKGKKK